MSHRPPPTRVILDVAEFLIGMIIDAAENPSKYPYVLSAPSPAVRFNRADTMRSWLLVLRIVREGDAVLVCSVDAAGNRRKQTLRRERLAYRQRLESFVGRDRYVCIDDTLLANLFGTFATDTHMHEFSVPRVRSFMHERNCSDAHINYVCDLLLRRPFESNRIPVIYRSIRANADADQLYGECRIPIEAPLEASLSASV